MTGLEVRRRWREYHVGRNSNNTDDDVLSPQYPTGSTLAGHLVLRQRFIVRQTDGSGGGEGKRGCGERGVGGGGGEEHHLKGLKPQPFI